MDDDSPAGGTATGSPAGPITAYRWFQITGGGVLAGARDVPWPTDRPLRAHHVGDTITSERSGMRPPLASVLCAALPGPQRPLAVLAGVGILVALALTAGPVIAGVVAAAAAALGWQIARRHQGLADAVMRVSAGVLACCAAILAAAGVWLLVDAGLAASTDRWDATGRGVGGGVACWVMAGPIVGLLAVYFRPPGGSEHVCPSPPRRFLARWTPECGIYAYRSLPLAARAARREWALAAPVVLARVSLWGRVFPYSAGYRAQWARIECLYDDASGQVEVPAAAYGVAVEPLPAGLALPAARGPATLRKVLSAAEGLRRWAEQHQAGRR